MKELSNDQILTAQKPDRPGRQKITPSENYENIYKRGRDSFRDLKQIAEILDDIEKHAHRFENAQNLIDLFGFEKFKPILEAIFPKGKEIGGSMDDRIYFDETKVNMQKIIFASNLIKFSGDYLLQAFPEGEYDYLHPRIEALVSDLKTMVETFNKNKELERQLEEYKKHVEYFEPISPSYHDRNYDVSCQGCRVPAIGETKEKALENITHLPKCNAPKITDKNWTSDMEKWYIIHPPKLLIITWEQREKLRELEDKAPSKN